MGRRSGAQKKKARKANYREERKKQKKDKKKIRKLKKQVKSLRRGGRGSSSERHDFELGVVFCRPRGQRTKKIPTCFMAKPRAGCLELQQEPSLLGVV